jgi:hypothetical protein
VITIVTTAAKIPVIADIKILKVISGIAFSYKVFGRTPIKQQSYSPRIQLPLLSLFDSTPAVGVESSFWKTT